MCSQCRVSKLSGSLCAPYMLSPKGYRSQTTTGSIRCLHQSWRLSLGRPSIETIACVLGPNPMGIHQRDKQIGRRIPAQLSLKSSSSQIQADTRADASSRFRRVFGVWSACGTSNPLVEKARPPNQKRLGCGIRRVRSFVRSL